MQNDVRDDVKTVLPAIEEDESRCRRVNDRELEKAQKKRLNALKTTFKRHIA